MYYSYHGATLKNVYLEYKKHGPRFEVRIYICMNVKFCDSDLEKEYLNPFKSLLLFLSLIE